jgi:methylmalonyl-CoA mutase, C-terminal domain
VGTGPAVLKPRRRKTRVLVAKVGLDGHDVGARVIARGLVDHGMEVVYTGIRRTPEQVAAAARDEDVDVIGVSILSGAHVPLLERLGHRIREAGIEDVLLIVGGIVPEADLAALSAAGVDAVFHPETTIGEVVEFIEANVERAAT